jgi:hypothetical protein
MSEYSMRSFTQIVQNRTCSTLTIFPKFRNLTTKQQNDREKKKYISAHKVWYII